MLKTVSTQLALASDTLPEVLAKGNTTGGTDLAVSSGDDITFADNSKAIFGAGSDISIYSDGSTGQVTGNVNVAGSVTADGLTVDGVGVFTTADNGVQLTLISTDTDALVGPQLNLWRNSGAGTNGDLIGQIKFTGEDTVGSTNTFATIYSIADQTNNGAEDGSLHFQTLINGSLADRLLINSAGNLLVGAATVADVNGLVTNHLFEGASGLAGKGAVGVYNNTGTANAPALMVMNRDTSTDSSNRFVQFNADVSSLGSTAMGAIVGNGANNAQFAATSDIREKTNIESISGSLAKINNLNPVEFDWIASNEHCNAGFVAQEVEEIFPEFVVENMSTEGSEERKGLTGGMTGGIVPHLVKAIQEQQAIIESITARIEALEA